MADVAAGLAMDVAFDLLFGSVKSTIKKAVICKETLEQIQKRLEALSPLIQEMKGLNRALDRPESELKGFTSAMNKGRELVEKCSKVTCWEFWKKSRYTDKLLDLDKNLNALFEVLQLQQHIDVKKNQILNHKILDTVGDLYDAVKCIKKAIVGGTGRIQGEYKYKIFPPEFTVGLDAPLKCLKKKLLEEDRSVLLLTAPGGSGKTTLAKMLCGDNQIKEKFGNNILFVKVSQTPNLNLIVQELYQNKDMKVPYLRDDEDAVDHLKQFLMSFEETPILLVLDDVWSGSESLIEKFSLQIPKYKILVTSRFVFPRFEPRYDLEILNPEDAVTLFRHYAFSKDKSSHNIPVISNKLVNQVVQRCKNIPLALKLVGSSLRNQPKQIWKQWSEVTSILKYEDELLACLQRNIDVLGPKDNLLKDCFMDLGSFPEDKLIHVATLIDLWTELYEYKDYDVIASLIKLTYHNLANFDFKGFNKDEEEEEEEEQEEEEEDYDYNKVFVTQHDMLRELAIHQSEQDPKENRKRLIVEITSNNVPEWWNEQNEQPFDARLLAISIDGSFLSEWCDIKLPKAEALVLNFKTQNHHLPEFVKNMSKLRVLIITNYAFFPTELTNFQLLDSLTNLKRIRLERIRIPSLKETPIVLQKLLKLSLFMCEIGQAFTSTKISQVFPNLEEINIDYGKDLVELPAGICDLIKLKKLKITHCHNLSTLPEEVGNLFNLEVLRLRSCVDLENLPDSISKLSKLTFIDISNCFSIRNLPKHIGELQNLKNLSMKNCSRLLELPPSVLDFNKLNVVCDEELKELWEFYLPADDSDINLKLVKDDVNLNWLENHHY